jgi:hypothetical protein
MRSFEVTYGQNGWHPHFHIIFISRSSVIENRISLSSLWARAVARQGLPAPSVLHGYDVRDGSEAGTYLNKFADDSKLDLASPERCVTSKGDFVTWDAADEMTKAHSKKGRKGNLTPFDFLRVLRFSYLSRQTEDVVKFKRLWEEYALAMRGRSRVQWSRGLRDLVGIDHVDDSEALERLEDRAREVVGVIPEQMWPLVFTRGKHDRRSELLEVAEEMGIVGVAYFLWNHHGLPKNTWPGFLDSMFSDVSEYQQNTSTAGRAHWQSIYPVNSESAVDSAILKAELFEPLSKYRVRLS